GLGFTKPLVGFCLALFALSAAGVPPTAGFISKYLLLWEVAKAGNYTLVILAVLGSLIGMYYYLQVLVHLYMQKPREFAIPGGIRMAGVVGCVVLLVIATISPKTITLYFLP